MENTIEIKEKLNGLYAEYIEKNNKLYAGKEKEAAVLMKHLSGCGEIKDVAQQIARFSGNITKLYFNELTRNGSIPLELIDEVLESVYLECNKAKDKQHNVRKFSYAVSAVMRNYEDRALASLQLPKYVVFIAQYAVKSQKNQDRFKELINSTMGNIYLLDYSEVDHNSLKSLWDATCLIRDDISKEKYAEIITEWAVKYNFIQCSDNQHPAESDISEKTEIIDPSTTVLDRPSEKPVISDADNYETVTSQRKEINHEDDHFCEEKPESDETYKNTQRESQDVSDILAKKTTEELSKGKSEILSAVYASADNVIKAIREMLAGADNDREKAAECDRLKATLSGSEKKINEQEILIAELMEKTSGAVIKYEDAVKKTQELETKNAELEEKLREAYSINSREESMEAEKIRSELKNALIYLYEDWLDYEFSDVSEENYESLQAIIKKMFRTLESSGIDFKEKK